MHKIMLSKLIQRKFTLYLNPTYLRLLLFQIQFCQMEKKPFFQFILFRPQLWNQLELSLWAFVRELTYMCLIYDEGPIWNDKNILKSRLFRASYIYAHYEVMNDIGTFLLLKMFLLKNIKNQKQNQHIKPLPINSINRSQTLDNLMKNQKDQGNIFFKQEKYSQAIQCYQKYVSVDHPDNSKAYSNMALGCFKLKRYTDCIYACQKAVQIEPEFQKPYFRMYEAYQQLKDNYGILLAGSKFCKHSKQQKQLKVVQKQLIRARQQLSFKLCTKASSQSDMIILQIINQGQQSKQIEGIRKEPQTSLQSKWQKIEQKIRTNRQQGLNMARKFLSQDFLHGDLRQKYKKILLKLKNQAPIISNQNSTYQKIKIANQSGSDEQQIRLEELQQYAASKLKINGQIQKIQKQNAKQAEQLQSEPLKDITPNQTAENRILQSQKTIEVPVQTSKKQTDSTLQRTEENWQDFVKQNQVEQLFITHFKSKMQKADDQFQRLFNCLCNTLRSTELNKFQKQAVLSAVPSKVKKFSMLMKSYTGRQKLELVELFTSNKLHSLMQNFYLKK